LEQELLAGTVVKRLCERAIVEFLDWVIMSEMKKRPLSGYDVILHVDKKFNYLVSSGTVYSTLYSMERKGLIELLQEGKKRTYKLSEKGLRMTYVIEGYIEGSPNLAQFILNVLNVNHDATPFKELKNMKPNKM
jgi:DNA-binding PadR family transcriptional regulator